MRIISTKHVDNSKIKSIIYGLSGSGKTSLAKTIKQPTLIISVESGLLALKDSTIDVIDITKDNDGKLLPEELRIQRLKEVYNYILTEECMKKYKHIFIDSLSEVAENLIKALDKEFPDRKDALPKWQEYNKRIRIIIKGFRDIPHYDITFSCLAEIDKDEFNKRYMAFSMAGKISQLLPSLFDEVFYLSVTKNEEGESVRKLITQSTDWLVCKDRSGKLLPEEQPNLDLIFNKIRGEENGK